MPLAEETMELVLDPAALGGLAGLIALASWALGRTHGRLAGQAQLRVSGSPHTEGPPSARAEPPFPADAAKPAPAAVSPCQQRAQEERRALLARPVALAELHAEVSAIRRDERILEHAPDNRELIILPHSHREAACRYLGLSGQPTCPGATRSSCPDRHACHGIVTDPAIRALSNRL